MVASPDFSPLAILNPEDYAELKSVGLTDSQIIRLGHYSQEDKKEAKKQTGINHRGLVFRYLDPATGLPYLNSKGKPFVRMKPRDWSETWNDPIDPPHKYMSAKGEGNKPYWSPLLQHFNLLAKKTKFDLDITEGEKKADALAAHGVFCVGLAGVNGWLDKEKRLDEIDIPPAQLIEDDEQALKEIEDKLTQSRMIPELKEALDWQYRRTNIVFDSDVNIKRQVRGAVKDLAIALAELGAEPYVVRLPNELDGSKNGIDDFISRHGMEAYNFLKKIAKPAFKKQKFHFPKEPTQYEKFIMAWAVMKDSWRYRPGVGWYEWTGTRWVGRTTAEFQEAVTAFQDAQGWEFPVGKDVMIHQLQSRMLIRDDRWNPTHLLGFANGVLSIKDNTFTEGHNHEDFLTVVLPYDFSPSAQCPRWINFLNEALGGDQDGINLLQAFCKWILLPKPRNKKAEIEKCLDLQGTKGTGKGTFLDILIALVGSENIAAIGQKTFESSTHLADLLDKKLSVDSDAFGFFSNIDTFNKVVSNEPVSIKRLYKDPITTRLGTTIVRAYNNFLEVPHGAEGIDRRIIVISFNNQPKVADLELSEKLQQELPGIFSWAWSVSNAEMKKRITWAGAVRSVAEASTKRFEANNPEYSFLKAVFPTGNPQVKASELYQSYQLWCKDDAGISPKKRRKFSEALQTLGCEHKRTMDGYFYSIPSMEKFDVAKFLGLSKKILPSEKLGAENVHNVHAMPETTEKSMVSSMNILAEGQIENVHNVHVMPETVEKSMVSSMNILAEEKRLLDPPFDIGDQFAWFGEQLEVKRIGMEVLYCHIVNGTTKQNESYIRVSIEEAQKIKNEHSQGGHEHSNVHGSDRMFMPETPTNKGVQPPHEHYEHSRPQKSLDEQNVETPSPTSWTKSVFAAIKEKPAAEFPSVGCKVGKLIDGRESNWRGYIREIIDDVHCRVWWSGHFRRNRNGKPIKGKDGKCEEELSFEQIANLYAITDSWKAPDEGVPYSAQNLQLTISENVLDEGVPYSAQHLPRSGDRVENCSGRRGLVVRVSRSSPRYEIQWDNDDKATRKHDLADLTTMGVRKVGEVSHANG